LWQETIFSEVIRLVLECLDSSDTTLCALSKSWLREACDTHLCCLLDPLYEDLITLQPQYSFVQVDTERILYLMNLLSSVFSVDSCRLLSFMSKHTISSSLQQLCSNFHRQNDMYIHVEPLIEKNHDNPGIGKMKKFSKNSFFKILLYLNKVSSVMMMQTVSLIIWI
jgi:hypothetical protein